MSLSSSLITGRQAYKVTLGWDRWFSLAQAVPSRPTKKKTKMFKKSRPQYDYEPLIMRSETQKNDGWEREYGSFIGKQYGHFGGRLATNGAAQHSRKKRSHTLPVATRTTNMLVQLMRIEHSRYVLLLLLLAVVCAMWRRCRAPR